MSNSLGNSLNPFNSYGGINKQVDNSQVRILVDANYPVTLTAVDAGRTIVMGAPGGARILTLPIASTCPGAQIRLICPATYGANSVAITAPSANNMRGAIAIGTAAGTVPDPPTEFSVAATTLTLTGIVTGSQITCISDGINWHLHGFSTAGNASVTFA